MLIRNIVAHKHFQVKHVTATVFIITTRQTSCFDPCLCVSLSTAEVNTHDAIGQSHAPPPDMFKLVHLGDSPLPTWGPPPDMFKLAHYVSQTSVSKWAFDIRLKFLLIIVCFGWVVVFAI